MSDLRLDHMTREEVTELAPRATVVVPLGSTEQHGPHLPVCTDTAIVSHLAERAVDEAAATVPAVVAPALPFGFAHHHLPFGATMSIGMLTYLEVLTDLGASLHTAGFRRLIFLNGHGGNDAAVRAVGDRLVFERGLDIQVAGTSYWTCAAAELTAMQHRAGGPVPGHAGGFETSCMLALGPDRVRWGRRPAAEDSPQPLAYLPVAVRQPDVWSISDGRTDDSSQADETFGGEALGAIGSAVARFIVEFHQARIDTRT